MAAKKYTTPDLGLDCFLEDRLGTPSELEYHSGMMLFVRPETAALNKAVSEYFGGGQINAIRFAQLMRRKKAEMFTRKKMAEQGQRTGS
jgi:hypothetical protein